MWMRILLYHDLVRPSAVGMQVHALLLPPLLPDRPELLLHAALHLVGQNHHILDVQVAKLGLVVNAVAVLVPFGHALALHPLHMAGLDDLAPLAPNLDDVAVEVGDVPLPVAHPRLPQANDLPPEKIVVLPPEEDSIDPVGVLLLQVRLLLGQHDDQVASLVVGARVRLVLVDQPRVPGRATGDIELHGRGVPHDAGAVAHGTPVLDDLAPAAALVALGLDLLEHARRELVLRDPHAVPAAVPTRVDDAVGRARAAALLADVLFLPLELGRPAVVEVAQRDADLNLDVGAAPHAMAAEVTASAEEPAEKVEWVVMAASTALLSLLQTLVAILIVDLAGLGVDEGFVGFGDFDELVLGSIVAAVHCGTLVSWTWVECMYCWLLRWLDLRVLVRVVLLG